MKKVAVILLALLLTMVGTAALADAAVSYEGGAEKFVFLPGSAYSNSDLFENFKNVLPGDSLVQKITVRNDTNGKVRLYMRAEMEGMQDREFLSQLKMTVECRDQKIFDAAPSETAQLTNNTLLGTFNSRGSTELTVTLTVPADMGNEYMSRIGVVPWTFVAEEIPDEQSPHTGDWFQTGVWVGVALLLTAMIVVLLIVQRKRREKTN